ncbi:flagellar hook capping FlgD N-terminal domain-containing protein [Photobacterium aphoticum]|uniref:Basal-body rod modification protein FlgD n=1 Tax=Photobacterium aphoticum TaxID=754436 RepID=A0A0J1GLP4_9GAMM|nr:flagellar hook capping FlgD N-terminal domain-containing protein [Photobacterium aphoticum]KLV00628.1 flagellar basal body rod modification protein FlgD [Photobacterium aphoticum]PSU48795.1 flagellar biosynthesis protein FlgD [Photobacterium aphoticum]GHA58962.1 basal-body rod modification protein FlgD [Photobacterium aphoticum]
MSLAQIRTTAQYSQEQVRTSEEPNVSGNGTVPTSNGFLTMMVAQIQNQNPLNPTDGTQYLTQLGMMSAVESLEGVKMGMMNMNIGITNLEMLQATNLVGKKVLMDVKGELDVSEGQTLEGRVKFDQAVDKATVMVYDDSGELVDKIELGPQGAGMAEFTIDGDELGTGEYSFEVMAETGGEAWSQKIMIAADVESVNIPADGGAIMLSLKGVGVMSMYDMREITV